MRRLHSFCHSALNYPRIPNHVASLGICIILSLLLLLHSTHTYPIYVQTLNNTFYRITPDSQQKMHWDSNAAVPDIACTTLHNTTATEYFLVEPHGKLYLYENEFSATRDSQYHRYSASPLNLVDWIRYGKPWSKSGNYYHSRMNSSYLLLDADEVDASSDDTSLDASWNGIHEYSAFPHGTSATSSRPTRIISTSPRQLHLLHMHYSLHAHHYHIPQYSVQFHDYHVLHNEDAEWSEQFDKSFQDFYVTLTNQLHVVRVVDDLSHNTEHTIYQFDSLPVNLYVYVEKEQKFFKKKLSLAVPPQIYQPSSIESDGVVYVQLAASGTTDINLYTDSTSNDSPQDDTLLTLSPIEGSTRRTKTQTPPEHYHLYPIPQNAKLINYPLPNMDFHPAQLKLLPSSRSTTNNFSENASYTTTESQSFSHNQYKKTGLHGLRKFRSFETLPSFERLPMISMDPAFDGAGQLTPAGYWAKHNNKDTQRLPVLLLPETPHPTPQNPLNRFVLNNIWWILLILLSLFVLGGLMFYVLHTKQLKQMELNSQQQLHELHEQQQLLLSKQKAALKEKLKESIAKHSRIKENEKQKQIGPLVIYKKRIIGRGSNGTVVFEGELGQRQVAVKRMLKDFHEHIHNEISILIESDQHRHVVRYYAKEEDDLFIYLALELCPCTLDEAIEMQEEAGKKAFELNERIILTQLVEAVHHIHSLNIVHRDIKPQNVLLDSNYHIKLSDMGLGKRIDKERSSFTMGSLHKGAGSIGWHAPEVFHNFNIADGADNMQRLTKKVDIFSLGCVMYYVLTKGEHPYGNPSHRESNIMNGEHDLKHLKQYPDYVRSLIKKMIQPDPEKRYSIEQVMKHPYFWDDQKKLAFLCDVSDELGKEREESTVYKELEGKRRQIFGATKKAPGWNSKLDTAVLNGVVKFRKYDFERVWDLLRLIRNIRAHYREYDEGLKSLLAPPPEGIFRYFDKTFPLLFSVVFSSVSRNWRDREVFEPYF